MKCYLHIGTEKTATTTIQNFLHLNRGCLYDAGYFYTKSVGQFDNRDLPVAAYDLDRRDDRTQCLGLDSTLALSDYQKGVISRLQQEIQTADGHAIIFSSEHIQSRYDPYQ